MIGNWRIGIAAAVMSLAAVATAATAAAQPVAAPAWPTKPIRAFIPFGAGSATDVVPRAVFDLLAMELGQPIVIENRGGAGGSLGVGAVVRAEADGYTILANSSAHTVAPWIVPNLPYDVARDLAGVLMIGQSANVLIAPLSKGWKAVEDLVAAAKARRGTTNYGSAGVGTGTHLAAEKFRLGAGFEAVHIPYKGGAEALTDVLGGRIDFYFCPISTALPLIRDGRVQALLVSTPARVADLPEVPTSREAGFGDSNVIWFGVFMPAKTPRGIVDKFHAAGMKVLASLADARKAQPARGRADADDARGDRQAGRRRDRCQRKADQGRRHSMSLIMGGRACAACLRECEEWTSGRSPTNSRSRRRSMPRRCPPSPLPDSVPSSATVPTENRRTSPAAATSRPR
jgi:tripartite-type tricarboxylate transporter receptor subunit TctC